jgi:hypothetical protein
MGIQENLQTYLVYVYIHAWYVDKIRAIGTHTIIKKWTPTHFQLHPAKIMKYIATG